MIIMIPAKPAVNRKRNIKNLKFKEKLRIFFEHVLNNNIAVRYTEGYEEPSSERDADNFLC